MGMGKGHRSKERREVREETVRKQDRGINTRHGEGRGQREGLWERAARKERRVCKINRRILERGETKRKNRQKAVGDSLVNVEANKRPENKKLSRNKLWRKRENKSLSLLLWL